MARISVRVSSSRLLLIVLLGLYCAAAVPAGAIEQGTGELPFDNRLRQSLQQMFYEGSTISLRKISVYEKAVTDRYQQVKDNLVRYYLLKQKKSPKKAQKKMARQGHIESYVLLLDYISRMKRIAREDPTAHAAFGRLAVKALDLDDGLKVVGKRLQTGMMAERLSESLKSRKIPIHTAPNGEASNLRDPVSGLFFNQRQLARMKKNGIDISAFNPPGDSTVWQDHDISSVDVRRYYREGLDPLHRGLKIIFPRGKGYYDKIRRTQTKPKIDIFIPDPDGGEPLSFKLKVGSEMHAEPTAASLYAALGFSVDISRYVRDFKLVLGDVPPHQFKKDWDSYYSRYDVDRYIKDQGKDGEGYYVIFYEGILEARPEELLRVGRWAFEANGHSGLREIRGSLLFDLWIAYIDLHENENNKLVLRKTGEDYRFFHIQHDMGFSFGWAYNERPGEFRWNLVKKKTDDYVYINYRSFQKISIFKYITYADARWMARLIAQLSREQIRDAVELGGWPSSMGKLILEKLINRRNQLVQAFGLEGERLPNGKPIALLPVNRRLTTADGVVVNGKLKKYTLPEFTKYFGPRIRELIPLVLRQTRNLAVDGAVNLVSGIRYLEINPEQWFGEEFDLITRIILRVNREIQPNPSPSGEDDTYLVKDTTEIGFRLGYGFILSADLTYSRRYTVVYPVKTMEQGRFHNNFVFDLILGSPLKKHAHSNFPGKYVVMSEDFLETRGRFKLADRVNDVEGGTLALSKIYLHRHFISRKTPDRLIVFEDTGHFNQLALKIYLEFGYLLRYRIPFFKTENQKGILERQYVETDLSDIEQNPGKKAALEQLFLHNDPAMIKKLGVPRVIDDTFFQRRTYFTLLGLIKRRSIYRVDRLKEAGQDAGAPGKSYRFQVESQKQRAWRLLDNGERRFSWVRLTGASGGPGGIAEPLMTVTLRIDDRNTTDNELKFSYLKMLNDITADQRFMDFDSAAHSRNRRWGYVQVYLDMIFYKEAIEALLNVDEEEIWKGLAGALGRPVEELKQKSRPPDYRRRPPAPIGNDIGRLALRTADFIRKLKSARKAKDTLKKMAYLVKAVRRAVHPARHGFDPVLLSIINKIGGKENFHIRAIVTMPVHRENMFPERVPLYGEVGIKRELKPDFFQYIFEDPVEIYYLF